MSQRSSCSVSAVVRCRGEVVARLGHVDPPAGVADEQSLALQFQIGPRDGVRIDDQFPRELSHGGKARFGLEFPASNRFADLLCELLIDGQPAGGIDVKAHASALQLCDDS